MDRSKGLFAGLKMAQRFLVVALLHRLLACRPFGRRSADISALRFGFVDLPPSDPETARREIQLKWNSYHSSAEPVGSTLTVGQPELRQGSLPKLCDSSYSASIRFYSRADLKKRLALRVAFETPCKLPAVSLSLCHRRACFNPLAFTRFIPGHPQRKLLLSPARYPHGRE